MRTVLLTSSILIVVIATLRQLLRGKIDPRLQYALWLVVALRLLLPVNFVDSAYSVLVLLGQGQEPARVAEAIGQTIVPIQTQSYDSAYIQLLREYEQKGVDTSKLNDTQLARLDAQARELAKGPTLAGLAGKYARPVWLGGAAVMGLWFLLVNLRLRRKLRLALPLGTDCFLPVYVTTELPSPCLCGLFRPAIYLTPDAVADPDRMRHVMAHELTHYRHRDHWWALVRCLCLCVYWFNPLVWWAAALSRQDCELACDAGAIRRLGENERLPYGRTLVTMIAAGRNSLLQTATTMTGGKRRMKERVRLIARRPRTAIALTLAALLLVGCAVGCTFTDALEDSPETGTSQNPTPPNGLDADTLPQRLEDIPEALWSKVDVYTGDERESLATYWLNDPKWVDQMSGYLMNVYRIDKAQFQKELDRGWSGDVEIFAWDGGQYYAILSAGDGRYTEESELCDEYWAAFYTIRDHVMDTVLATAGVEPYVMSSDFFSNKTPQMLQPGSYAIDGMDYTPVTSYKDVPDDPEQWYLVGWLPNQPVWMFTRDYGQETMLQIDEKLTQVFPYTARFFGGGNSPDGRAPQFMGLEGFSSGTNGTHGPFAVITHLFQGGMECMYQLTVYDLDTDPVITYVHDWKPLMEDFNANRRVEVDEASRTVTVTYQGQSTEITLQEDDALWPTILGHGEEYGYNTFETAYSYAFNADGTVNLIMDVEGLPVCAAWIVRFAGGGFETVGFHFLHGTYAAYAGEGGDTLG